jgi:putative thioredoxin
MSNAALPYVIEPSEQSFAADVIEQSAQTPVVVDFWAPWCGPCRLLTPVLEKLAGEFGGQFILAKVNTEVQQSLAAAFRVQSIPTVVAFRDRQLIDMFQGALPEAAVREWLLRLLPTEAERLIREAAQCESGDAARAEPLYRRALQFEPQYDPARIGLARTLLVLGRLEEAALLIAELEARGYLEPEAERVRSQLHLLQASKQGGGVAVLRRRVEADPGNLTLRVQLADALAAVGETREALETCLQVIRQDRIGVGPQAKQAMLDILNTLDDDDLASEFRRKLASLLY